MSEAKIHLTRIHHGERIAWCKSSPRRYEPLRLSERFEAVTCQRCLMQIEKRKAAAAKLEVSA